MIEGVYATKAVLKLARTCKVNMSIVEQINKVLFKDAPALEEVEYLLHRDKVVLNTYFGRRKGSLINNL
ncbi:MAG: hypothetical protein Q4G58_15135 [bacterium]|nr:hypothetical protein [bacterium]